MTRIFAIHPFAQVSFEVYHVYMYTQVVCAWDMFDPQLKKLGTMSVKQSSIPLAESWAVHSPPA